MQTNFVVHSEKIVLKGSVVYSPTQLELIKKHNIDKNLFALLANLPCKKVESFTQHASIPDAIGKDSLSIIYTNEKVYLGIKLSVHHEKPKDTDPTTLPAHELHDLNATSFDMLIELSGDMRVLLSEDLYMRQVSPFKLKNSEMTNEQKEIFLDNETMKDAYDPKWLVTRLSQGKPVNIPHLRPTGHSYGHWIFSPKK